MLLCPVGALLLWTTVIPVDSNFAVQGVYFEEEVCWVGEGHLQVSTRYTIFGEQLGNSQVKQVCIQDGQVLTGRVVCLSPAPELPGDR